MKKNKLELRKERTKNFTTSQGVIVKEYGKPNIHLLAKKLLKIDFNY